MVTRKYINVCVLVFAALVCLISGQRTVPKLPEYASAESVQANQNLKMSIYYETLCPDSLNLLENQLLDIFYSKDESVSQNRLESLVDIELIPYGKAMTFEAEADTNKFSFICQHGPLECEGNKMHTCAIKAISKVPKTRLQNLIKFLTCSMKNLMASPEASTSSPSRNLTSIIYPILESCLEDLQLKTPELFSNVKNEVEKCLETEEGSSLLKINGDLTRQLSPKIFFVPWVTFNGNWRRRLMEEALKDLRKVLCQLVIMKSLATSSTTNQEIQGCEKYYPIARLMSGGPGGSVFRYPAAGAGDIKSTMTKGLTPGSSGNDMKPEFGASIHEPTESRKRYGRGTIKRIGSVGDTGNDRRRFIHSEVDTIHYGGWRIQQGSQRARDWRRPIIR